MFEILSEFYKLALDCVTTLRTNDPKLFIGSVLAGLTVGGLLWWGSHFWAHLWNRSFNMTPLHHVLAAIVLALAVLYAVTSVALKYTANRVETRLQMWQQTIDLDADLKNRLSAELYDSISAEGKEDMSRIPDPRSLQPGERWQFQYSHHESTQPLVGEIYTRGALQHFKRNHSLLAAILSPDVSSELIVEDIRLKSSSSPGAVYELSDGTRLIVQQMMLNLRDQVWRVVTAARAILLGLFLLFLLAPLTLIAIAAYKGIKAHRLSRSHSF
jgi:hypothetical protein